MGDGGVSKNVTRQFLLVISLDKNIDKNRWIREKKAEFLDHDFIRIKPFIFTGLSSP
jgi:hypothetical protein